ncbi:DUF4221 domain-containing protein [Neolewinella aurantiaca]|uniref:DUF4221 domain-containing protein n=1 Tax=Neolewinella aurantiaca TaxID=2602767 RepID=A0A5C7FA90_9BACT|nr:DUF4221 family protein [Neolewinella aurantiaca]TXF87701.1 DUF4221 domain-containing protein [Neolewinella aurantiaca]
MNNLLLLTVVVFMLSSCTSDESLQLYNARLVDHFSIVVPPDSKHVLKSSKYLAPENAIYGLNFDNQSIYISYLNDEMGRYEKIELVEDGPSGVGTAYSLSVHSRDSIFLTTGVGIGGLSVLNRSGDLLKTLKYDFGGVQAPEYTGFRNRNQKDIFIYKDSLLFFPQRVPYRGARPQSVEHKPIGCYDLAAETYSLVDFGYPAEYWSENLLDDFSFTGNGMYLYFGLVAQHFIWKIDVENNTSEKVIMKSSLFPEDFEGQEEFDNVYDRTDFLVIQPKYSSILTDPYRDLIYRIAVIPYEDDAYSKSKSVQLFQYPDNFTVIACTGDGKYVGEFTFPSRTYYPYGMFVSEEGLNVPKSHPEYLIKSGSEDEVEFDIYDLSQ